MAKQHFSERNISQTCPLEHKTHVCLGTGFLPNDLGWTAGMTDTPGWAQSPAGPQAAVLGMKPTWLSLSQAQWVGGGASFVDTRPCSPENQT